VREISPCDRFVYQDVLLTQSGLDGQTPRVVPHFGYWGMEVHEGILDSSGEVTKESKSEVLFCSAPLRTHTRTRPPLMVLTSRTCCCRVVGSWPSSPSSPTLYLGDTVAHDGSDGSAVDCRISSAGKAFGVLRKGVCSRAQRCTLRLSVLSLRYL
jgi:hypothetical protein